MANTWPKEPIPDPDRLFYRVHENYVPNGKLGPHVFGERHGSMSVDWERYSTAEASRQRARDPGRNGIVALVAGYVCSTGLRVEHSPDHERGNRAHTDVFGLEGVQKTELRLKLYKSLNGWEISPSSPLE